MNIPPRIREALEAAHFNYTGFENQLRFRDRSSGEEDVVDGDLLSARWLTLRNRGLHGVPPELDSVVEDQGLQEILRSRLGDNGPQLLAEVVPRFAHLATVREADEALFAGRATTSPGLGELAVAQWDDGVFLNELDVVGATQPGPDEGAAGALHHILESGVRELGGLLTIASGERHVNVTFDDRGAYEVSVRDIAPIEGTATVVTTYWTT
jgi:hypothetical protein